MRLISLLVILFSAAQGVAQTISFEPVSDDVVWNRLEKYAGKNPEREQTLKAMFTDAGCPAAALVEAPVSHEKSPNVLCTIPGATDQVILVGAHFDYVNAGRGVVDNWSGASMLPSVLSVVLERPRQHTFIFIGFTGEEDGLVGSRDYIKHLSKEQRNKISAVINMDTLGLAPTEIDGSGSVKELMSYLGRVAHGMNLPVSVVNAGQVGESDSKSFLDARIPAITIHSLQQKTLQILHSPQDNIEQISRKDYLDTYHLMCGYLVFLDGYLDRPLTQTPAK